MYEAGLTCMRCRHNYEPCIISGYPLRKVNYILIFIINF